MLRKKRKKNEKIRSESRKSESEGTAEKQGPLPLRSFSETVRAALFPAVLLFKKILFNLHEKRDPRKERTWDIYPEAAVGVTEKSQENVRAFTHQTRV